MAQLVIGIGTSHTPMLVSDHVLWERRAKDDMRAQHLYNTEGELVSYAQLSAQVKDRYAQDLKKMEDIAQTTPGITQETLFKAVLSVVEQIDDPLIFGLGVCWLDQKGYSNIPMAEVLRLRGGNPPVD